MNIQIHLFPTSHSLYFSYRYLTISYRLNRFSTCSRSDLLLRKALVDSKLRRSELLFAWN